jgi:hypothetical protein
MMMLGWTETLMVGNTMMSARDAWLGPIRDSGHGLVVVLYRQGQHTGQESCLYTFVQVNNGQGT